MNYLKTIKEYKDDIIYPSLDEFKEDWKEISPLLKRCFYEL